MKCVGEIIREFVEIGEVLLFMVLFLNVKINLKKKNILSVITIAFIICLLRVYDVWNAENNLLLLYEVLDFFVIIFLMESAKYKKVIVYIFSYICTGTINIFSLWMESHFIDIPAGDLLDKNILRIITYLAISVFFILTKLLLKKEGNKKELEISTKSYVIFSIILFAITFYSGRILYMYTGEFSVSKITSEGVKILIGLVILFAYTLYIFFLVEERKSDKEKIYLRDQLLSLQQQYYSELKEKQQELEEVRHDMKAHFLQVTQLYKNGNINAFENYLYKLEKQWNYNKFSTISTNNQTADIIINYYENLAKKADIIFQCKGCFLDNLLIDEYDLCSLIFNGVSNAYEACIRYHTSNCEIKIEIKNFSSILFLTICNSYGDNRSKVFDWSTQKKDNTRHGFGINILTKNVEKYHGSVNYSIKSKLLYLEIMIPDIYKTTE